MSGGRPRTRIGTYGQVALTELASGRYLASTRHRDQDGRLRRVRATDRTPRLAEAELKRRISERRGFGNGVLGMDSGFSALADLWLEELEAREINEGTKDNYRDDLRVHVRPYFEHFTLAEITTARVEAFLKAERSVSYSRAKHSRTLLNQLFGFALRHDAMTRNPVEGTSQLRRPKGSPQALTVEQIARIRHAAAQWRTGAEVRGPRPDGQVRDALEVLLGTGVRPGEVLALRPVDVADTTRGMTVHINGTVVSRAGHGTYRQPHPKTEAAQRRIPVPDFAARVIRERLAQMTPDQSEWTIFHNKSGGPLTLHNFRRTFRCFLELAGLQDSGITPRWYRRTGATVIARGLGIDAAAGHLGHTSTAITEGHYVEPDRVVDFSAAAILELTLRPTNPDVTLLRMRGDEEEDLDLDQIDEQVSETGTG